MDCSVNWSAAVIIVSAGLALGLAVGIPLLVVAVGERRTAQRCD